MARLAPCLVAALALTAAIEARGANPPGALDLPPSNLMPAPVDITPTIGSPTIGSPTFAPRTERLSEPSGNPLWAIPLSALTATRERPLFLPSRRAPAPAVAGTPVVAAPPPPPTAAEPETPPLILVGSIVNETEGYAVFLDQATNNVIRLKVGQDHSGWVLRAVKGREATLEKNRQSATLALPVPGANTGPYPLPGVPGRPPIPGGPKPNEPEL